jgi:Tfp pilus assembly protein PilV
MKKNPRKTRQKGFALIVTLSLMILLTVIAVGLLSLSSISLRSTSQASATSVARSNARLAMMLALGELQAAMGPDKSVSAPASAVISAPPRPHLTGAWSSTDPADYWRWIPAAGGSPSYSSKASAFSRWLVSTPAPTDAEAFGFASSPEPSGTDAVTLVGDPAKPLKNSDDLSTTVVASKVKLANPSQPGKYGWAVFDESTKASIDLGDPVTAQAPGIEIASRTVPHRLRADALDKAKLATLEQPTNLVSLETASVPGIATATNSAAASMTLRQERWDFSRIRQTVG